MAVMPQGWHAASIVEGPRPCGGFAERQRAMSARKPRTTLPLAIFRPRMTPTPRVRPMRFADLVDARRSGLLATVAAVRWTRRGYR